MLISGFRLPAGHRGVGDAEAQVLDVVYGLVEERRDVVLPCGDALPR
jgi:hypothetical protein